MDFFLKLGKLEETFKPVQALLYNQLVYEKGNHNFSEKRCEKCPATGNACQKCRWVDHFKDTKVCCKQSGMRGASDFPRKPRFQ